MNKSHYAAREKKAKEKKSRHITLKCQPNFWRAFTMRLFCILKSDEINVPLIASEVRRLWSDMRECATTKPKNKKIKATRPRIVFLDFWSMLECPNSNRFGSHLRPVDFYGFVTSHTAHSIIQCTYIYLFEWLSLLIYFLWVPASSSQSSTRSIKFTLIFGCCESKEGESKMQPCVTTMMMVFSCVESHLCNTSTSIMHSKKLHFHWYEGWHLRAMTTHFVFVSFLFLNWTWLLIVVYFGTLDVFIAAGNVLKNIYHIQIKWTMSGAGSINKW